MPRLRPGRRIQYRDRALIEGLGLGEALLPRIKPGEVGQGFADPGICGTQGRLLNRQGAPVERFGLRILLEHLVQQGHVAEQFGKAWVLRGKALLGERQRLSGRHHGLAVIAGLVELRRLQI